MFGIGTRRKSPSATVPRRPDPGQRRRRLLVALGSQAVVAAVAAGYRWTVTVDPVTGTALTDYVWVALVSLFVAVYGAATVLLGTHVAAVGQRAHITRSLYVAGVCMLAAAAENVVEDGFKVDWLVVLWMLLIAVSWACLLFAGGTLLTARGTRLLGLLVAAPPPIALLLDFAGWLPAAFASAVGIAVLVARDATSATRSDRATTSSRRWEGT
jgi:hypothetical protein